MKHGMVLLSGIIAAALFGGCSNFFHELVPPDGDRIISFKIPGQVRAAMISDDAVIVTMEEGTDVRGLLPEITVSPRAKILPITFNYLQTAFPSADVLSAAAELYKSDDPAAYIENLVRSNKDFNIPALNIPIDFFVPVDIYVIAAQGNIRRYTVYVSVENETNPGGGIEWPRLLGMGFAKANNPFLQTDALCWIIEDGRAVNVTVRYMPDSGFSFALVPTFVIWGDRMEFDGIEIASDSGVIQFEAGPGKQTGILTLWKGVNSVSYTFNLTFTEDLGANGPMLEGLRFAKYDNPELVIDAVCNVYENSLTVSARAFYPVEMPYLSFALAPSFEILGERLEIDGAELRSGDETSVIQFNKSFGAQNKTLTVWRNGRSKDYALTITFEEDPDTVRSITDFRFVKQDNSGVAANAVASIVNTDNTGVITVQVFYSGAKPASLIPRFVSPGTVSVSGAAQTSGASSQDFSSALEYRVVSRNGQFVRTYTVRVEFVSLTDAAPRITSFRFSQNTNHALTQDSEGEIHDDTAFIIINAYYGGTFPPEQITPEFSAEGLVQVMGSVQVSAASPQDFSRPIRYTVVHPLNSLLKRDYWVYTTMIQDTASHAVITGFSFHPDDNPGLRDELSARIDQMTGKITIYAPIGSGLTTRIMYPRFTAAGQVNVAGIPQTSGASGQMFNSPVVYTVVSSNGLNRRDYTVEVRELTSTMYVNQNAIGSGDGTSWENAFRFLQTACEAAAQFPEDVPKEIWIAKGNYTPADIDGYFLLTPNTAYIGGFAGYETYKSQRNVAANTVTVTGDLGGDVYARQLFSTAFDSNNMGIAINGDVLFENLCLKDTNANNSYSYREKGRYGAGIFAILSSYATLSIANCTFDNMKASVSGGAVYARGGSTIITNTQFSSCSGSTGGTAYIDTTEETIITSVIITDTDGRGFGEGLCLIGNGNKTMENVTVKKVTSNTSGGGCITIMGNCMVRISDCRIEQLSEPCAGGLRFYDFNGNAEIKGLELKDIAGVGISSSTSTQNRFYLSNITGNNISRNAVYLYISQGAIILENSNFTNSQGVYLSTSVSNPVGVSGTSINSVTSNNALTIYAGSVTIDRVNINGVPNGRGINVSNFASIKISNSVIKNCKNTSESGGGIYMLGSGDWNGEISDTTIENVATDYKGGGIFCSSSPWDSNYSITIRGCIIRNAIAAQTLSTNTGSHMGGGLCSYGNNGSLTVINTLFDKCISYHMSGAIYTSGNNNTIIDSQFINCTANCLYRIFESKRFSIIRGCTFTHDANLPDMGEPTFAEATGYLFDEFGSFEDCTFNNLRSNKQGEAYLFELDYSILDAYLTLRNCTFNFQSGSAGLCIFSGYLLMDDCTINNSGGQQPLIRLTRPYGSFLFKPNNIYNGLLLDTAAKIIGLGSNVVRVENGAVITMVP